MTDESLPLEILRLRAQVAELASVAHQLRRSGLDSATTELLLARKRAKLEDALKRRNSGDH